MNVAALKSGRNWANWSLIAIFGLVYISGVAIPAIIAIGLGIRVAIKDFTLKLTTIERYLVLVTLTYLGYFFASSWYFSGLNEARDFLLANALFAFVLPLVYLMRVVDIDLIFGALSKFVFPASVLLLLMGTIERHYFGIARVDLLTISPLILAPLIVGTYYISVADWRNQTSFRRFGAVIAWLIGFYVIAILTQSRASALIYVMAAGVFFVLQTINYDRPLLKQLWKPVAATLVLAVLFIGLLYALYLSNVIPRLEKPLGVLFGAETELDASTNFRYVMATQALDRIGDAPIFGFGLDNTFSALSETWPFDVQLGHLHSDILNHLLGGGIIGLIIYLLVIATPILALVVNRNRSAIVIYICLMVVFLEVIGGLTARLFLRNTLYAWAIIAIVFAVGLSEQDRLGKFRPTPTD